MTPATTAQVRIWSARRHSRGSGWEARWSVGGKPRSKSFATRGLADTHLAELRVAANGGKPFDVRTGLPVSMARANAPTCLELGRDLMSSKWTDWAGKSRGSAAAGLRYPLIALVPAGKTPPDRSALVTALFRELRLVPGELPDNQAAALRWLETNSLPVDTLDRATVTAALTAIELNADGTRCVASTASQRRSMLTQLLGRAIDADLLPADILVALPKRATGRRVTKEVSLDQIGTVAEVSAVTDLIAKPEIRAFTRTVFYSGMRPAEVAGLRIGDLDLPTDGWGEATVRRSTPEAGKAWTDSGEYRDDRAPKHRADGQVRSVPLPPQLVEELRPLVDGRDADEIVFSTRNRTAIGSGKISTAWKVARNEVAAEQGWPAARLDVVYDLRHSAASIWLSAGVPVVEVADRLGHSPEVCLRIYAHAVPTDRPRHNATIEVALAV